MSAGGDNQPSMRKLLDIINNAQGQTPWNLEGFKYENGKAVLTFVPNPDYKGEQE